MSNDPMSEVPAVAAPEIVPDALEVSEVPSVPVAAPDASPAVVDDSKAIVDGVFCVRGSGFRETVLAGNAEDAAAMFKALHKLPEDSAVEVDFATVPPKPGDEVIGWLLVRSQFSLLHG